MRAKSPLTKRKEDFIFYYSKGFNKTQSAIKAGYSARTARQQGSRLFTNADIQQRLNELTVTGIYTLLDVAENSKNEMARVAAAKTLIEYTVGKPRINKDQSISVNINHIR